MTTKQTKARRALLDSATVLLADNPGASFIEIAEAAGIGRATLYRHFPTRESLLRALSLEAIEATDAACEAVIKDAATAMEALRLTLRALVPLGDRYYFLTRLPEIDDGEVNASLKRQEEEMQSLIMAAQEEGALDPKVPADWISAVFNNLIYAAWSLHGQDGFDAESLSQLAQRTLERGFGMTDEEPRP